jgi:hypothetical protein
MNRPQDAADESSPNHPTVITELRNADDGMAPEVREMIRMVDQETLSFFEHLPEYGFIGAVQNHRMDILPRDLSKIHNGFFEQLIRPVEGFGVYQKRQIDVAVRTLSAPGAGAKQIDGADPGSVLEIVSDGGFHGKGRGNG